MMKKCIIYVDILGFEKLAREIADKTGFDETSIRENYLSNPLREKIMSQIHLHIKPQTFKGISYIQGSDNYIVTADDLQSMFTILGELTTIKIPHADYSFIPVEIAVGIANFSRDDLRSAINEPTIISFMKHDIITPYHNYRKGGIYQTFVILTQELFQELELPDKEHCTHIDYGGKSFYEIELEYVRQRAKMYEFLKRIDIPGSKLYDRIDELYVPPIEYNEIRNQLEKQKIVFITGTKEYGKTYTAIRLLWEYFLRGCEPKWFVGEEGKERILVRKRLMDIERELKPRHILYFEDPFGRTRYESRESLERSISQITQHIKLVQDAYVILTSREEVFKEFEKEQISATRLKEFEKKLNIKRPSYDYRRRCAILQKWAEAKGCEWLKVPRLVQILLQSLKYEKNLPTPLSIRNLASETRTCTDEELVLLKIREKSVETEKSFAKEIRDMSDDKLVFLSFIFVSEFFELAFVESQYNVLIKQLKLKQPLDFSTLLTWFKNDKIDVVNRQIRFSHPSYSRAAHYLLVEDNRFTRIFGMALLQLADNSSALLSLGWIILHNFNKLPEDTRDELLFRLADKGYGGAYVAIALLDNFSKLDEDIRNKLLFKLAENDNAAYNLCQVVIDNFSKLDEDIRNKLLFKLAENDNVRGELLDVILHNFHRLPARMKKGFLFKIAEKYDGARTLSEAVEHHFNKLPVDIRNELLFKLADQESAAYYVAEAVEHHFNKLPVDIRNELLFKLADQESAAYYVGLTIAVNFQKLPTHIQELLFKLASKDNTVFDMLHLVLGKFDKIPERIRNELLRKLAKRHISGNYYLASEVAYHFEKMPYKVRNELILALVRNSQNIVVNDVIRGLGEKFALLPQSTRRKLTKLATLESSD